MTETSEAEEPAEEVSTADGSAGAMAIALEGARYDPELRDDIREFLTKQSRLIDDQRHHLRIQLRQLGLRMVGDRLRLVVQLFTVAAVLGLVVLVAGVVRDAMADHGLAIESFSTSPGLAARGLSGEALADQMLGRIEAIRRIANAHSITVSDDVRASGADSIKVEIPETGLSLDQVDRFLRRTLGRGRRLTGGASDDGQGRTTIDLHLSQADPVAVEGPSGDLDALMQQAAERAFAAFDPTNYVIYLRAKGRMDEALAAAERNYRLAETPLDVSDGLALWANTDKDRRRALLRAQLAAQAYPKGWGGWFEAAMSSQDLGHDEAALNYNLRMVETRTDDQWRNHRAAQAGLRYEARLRIDQWLSDAGSLDRDVAKAPTNDLLTLSGRYLVKMRAPLGRHDCARARNDLTFAQAAGPITGAALADVDWRLAVCVSDWRGALLAAQAQLAADQAPDAVSNVHAPALQLSLDQPRIALALAHNGRIAEANAQIAGTPLDCYLCVRTRGAIAALAGQTGEADRWYAEAARQAPSIAIAHQEWGEARLLRGDLDGAEAAFREASRRAPGWADPRKGLGDVAAHRQDWRGAIHAYDKALADAPAWAELKQARARVAARL